MNESYFWHEIFKIKSGNDSLYLFIQYFNFFTILSNFLQILLVILKYFILLSFTSNFIFK